MNQEKQEQKKLGRKPLADGDPTALIGFKCKASTKTDLEDAARIMGYKKTSDLLRSILENWILDFRKKAPRAT